MKTYLVTGGSGFIGSHLVRKLVEQKQNVHLIVEQNSDMWRIHDLIPQITMHEIDLADFSKITSAVYAIKPDVIFHLASYGGMPYQIDHDITFDVNFNGTVNLLKACKKIGFSCFIKTGSSSEYGIKNTAMSEDHALEPVTDYAVSKAAATHYCLKEALFNKLPVYTVRPFSVYGEYEMASRLIPTILLNTLQNKNINLSSPHFVRDFIYIDDIVQMYLDIVEKTPTEQYVFNAGSGIQSEIRDVVSATQSLWPQTLKATWGISEERPWEPKHWQASIKKSEEILGWKPQNTLREGLRKSLKWFEKNQGLYQPQVYEKKSKTITTKTF